MAITYDDKKEQRWLFFGKRASRAEGYNTLYAHKEDRQKWREKTQERTRRILDTHASSYPEPDRIQRANTYNDYLKKQYKAMPASSIIKKANNIVEKIRHEHRANLSKKVRLTRF
ncbi:hypothetical protein [Streptococcus sp. zg-JUN1979]|uniref:hypothetical protein n=1 Tax=Streptococcus sp. zg-JUN1979 TaxID=3391450 RepID=UPI0039A47244